MTKEEILKAVKEVVADHLSLETLTDDATVNSVGGDSLDTMDIAIALEKRFGIKITDEEGNQFQDMPVSEMAELIAKKLA